MQVRKIIWRLLYTHIQRMQSWRSSVLHYTPPPLLCTVRIVRKPHHCHFAGPYLLHQTYCIHEEMSRAMPHCPNCCPLCVFWMTVMTEAGSLLRYEIQHAVCKLINAHARTTCCGEIHAGFDQHNSFFCPDIPLLKYLSFFGGIHPFLQATSSQQIWQ